MAPDFGPFPDEAYEFRPLKLERARLRGADVYALQRALLACGMALPLHGADADFGKETDAAVRDFQRSRGLEVDGSAGPATQAEIVVRLIGGTGTAGQFLYGQLKHESSLLLGNRSKKYVHSDGSTSRDHGVAQRNDRYHPVADAYDPLDSIQTLVRHLRKYHRDYVADGVSSGRAWELAIGAWNAPSTCDRLALGLPVPEAERIRIEAYIDACLSP